MIIYLLFIIIKNIFICKYIIEKKIKTKKVLILLSVSVTVSEIIGYFFMCLMFSLFAEKSGILEYYPNFFCVLDVSLTYYSWIALSGFIVSITISFISTMIIKTRIKEISKKILLIIFLCAPYSFFFPLFSPVFLDSFITHMFLVFVIIPFLYFWGIIELIFLLHYRKDKEIIDYRNRTHICVFFSEMIGLFSIFLMGIDKVVFGSLWERFIILFSGIIISCIINFLFLFFVIFKKHFHTKKYRIYFILLLLFSTPMIFLFPMLLK